MTTVEKWKAAFGVAGVGVFVLGLIGWMMNVFALMDSGSMSAGEIALRVVGIFLPFIGAVVGWF